MVHQLRSSACRARLLRTVKAVFVREVPDADDDGQEQEENEGPNTTGRPVAVARRREEKGIHVIAIGSFTAPRVGNKSLVIP